MPDLILERVVPIEKAFKRLRDAPLDEAGEADIRIYKNAKMRLADFWPEELNLTSLYLLNDHLKSLRKLRRYLENRYGIDILKQSSVLHLRNKDSVLVGLAPPFVEIYREKTSIISQDRQPPVISMLNVPILIDGIHRAWLAREEGILLRCVLVSGALTDIRPYAYPNVWEEVSICDKKPRVPKYYRRMKQHSFMRPIRVLRQVSKKPPSVEWGR